MNKHKITKMSGKGDEVVAEWEVGEVTPTRLTEIETEFNRLMKAGYFAADLATNELVKEFDPNADYLMIPAMVGGCV